MQRYSFLELRQMVKNSGIRGWGFMNKDELCQKLGIVRIEHEPKYILKNTKTGAITKWRSAHLLGKTLGTNTGNVFYAIKNQRPLKINGVKHEITQVRS